jgi:hypothetical protein
MAIQKSEYTTAEQLARRAVWMAPDDPEILYLLVQSLQGQRKTTEAAELTLKHQQLLDDLLRMREMMKAMTLRPNDPVPRYEAGALAIRLCRPDQGLRWLQDALRIRPDFAPAKALLAEHNQRP